MADVDEKSREKPAVGPGHPPYPPFGPGNQMAKGHGRPKGPSFLSRVNKFGRWKAPADLVKAFRAKFPQYAEKLEGITTEDAAAMRFWMAVMSGESWALKELWERRDGKVAQQVNADVNNNAIVFNVRDKDQQDIVKKLLNHEGT